MDLEKSMDSELRELHLRGAIGAIRTAVHDGREHLIVPVVALMQGVIHAVNAPTNEFVPLSALSVSPQGWNGRPVVHGHPVINGKQVSANDPEILSSHRFGQIFKSRLEGERLLMEAWIDPERAASIGGDKFLERLKSGDQIEVSVGAYVTTLQQDGSHNGKDYKAVWQNIIPDHLAFLPNGIGACSISAGCGANRSAETYLVTAEGLEIVDKETPKPSIKDRIIALMSKVIGDTQPDDIATAVDEIIAAKAKMQDCEMCKGTGSLNGNPCEACDGNGEIKAAAGARHSSTDMQIIQGVHDHAVDLGAKCARDYKIAESNEVVEPQITAACRCEEADVTKTERIEALLKSEHNPLKDQKALEAASDKAIEALEAHVKTAAEKHAIEVKATEDAVKAAADAKEASDKAVAEANDKVTAAEAKLKAAADHIPTEEEYLQRAPESIRMLVAEKKAQDAAQKTDLVTKLKVAAAGVFSDEELNAKSISELLKLAQMAKLDTPKPDYSGRAVPRVASETDYSAPDPYAEGLKALQSVN